MNVFKRSLIHVRANIGKNILVFIIFLVTMGAISTTFISNAMYEKTLDEAFEGETVPVMVSTDYPDTIIEEARYDWEKSQDLSYQNYFDIADLDTVVDNELSMETHIAPGELSIPKAMSNEEYGIEGYSVEFLDQLENLYQSEAYVVDYDKAAFNDDPNSVIVSQMVLEANDLEVGDTITMDLNSDYDSSNLDELSNQELNIIGSYTIEPTDEMVAREQEYADEYYTPDLEFTYMNADLIMPASKGLEIVDLLIANDVPSGENLWLDEVYYLDNVDDVEQFETDAEALTGMPLEVRFITYDNDKLEGLDMIISIKEVIRYFIVLGLIVVIVLLSILITLFVRTRRKEIGILVALGERRVRIYYQLVLEQLIIMTLGFIVAYPICIVVLSILATKFGFAAITFNVVPLILSYLCGILIIGLVTLMPAVYTLRVSPKKILL